MIVLLYTVNWKRQGWEPVVNMIFSFDLQALSLSNHCMLWWSLKTRKGRCSLLASTEIFVLALPSLSTHSPAVPSWCSKHFKFHYPVLEDDVGQSKIVSFSVMELLSFTAAKQAETLGSFASLLRMPELCRFRECQVLILNTRTSVYIYIFFHWAPNQKGKSRRLRPGNSMS